MSKNLSGKVALVTGASRGIGAATAKRLAADGAKVAITYGKSKEQAESVAAEIKAAGGEALVIHGDALQPDNMPGVIDKVIAQYGRLDILVNNAGIFEGGVIGEITNETFRNTLAVNVESVFTLTNAAVKFMREGGRIINISSIIGQRAIFAGSSPYIMSKFAVAGLTRAWAHDLAPKGITVNAISPGPIATEMCPPDFASITAFKRLGTPEEIAATIAFLASPEASFITGVELPVDGGANA